MNENWLYGQYELDKNALLKLLQSNADSYMLYHDFDESQKQLFGNALRNISTGIKNGTLIGDGFGTFTDNTNTLTDDEITRLAFNFVHSVANALGAKTPKKKTPVKEIDEESEEVVVEKPDFDYARNGLYQDFNRKYNPFGTDNSYGVWKQNFTDQESLNNNLLLHIASHINNVGNGKYNWTNSEIDENSYIHGLNYLQDVIKTQGIEAAAPYLKYYGFDPNSFLYKLPLPEVETETEAENADAEVVVPIEKLQSQYNNMNAWEYVKGVATGNISPDSSDGWRIAGLAADILSVIDPEPFSAAGLGYASDYANYHADEMDGINDTYWDDALNVGLSTFGMIPILGDLGVLGKISKNIGKYAGILSKLLVIPGIFYGVANADEIKQSVENVIGGDFTVEDLRNTWTLVQLGFGVKNATKTGKGFKEAVEIDDAAQEALELLVKNNGRKQKLHFTGRHKQELEALQDNPEAFKKYLLDNFEGMDDIELANVTKSSELNRGEVWYKPKIVKSEKVNTETKLFSDQKSGRFNRARSFRKSTTDPINAPTVKGKPTTEPEPTVKPESETPAVETPVTGTPTIETPAVDIPKSTLEVEPTRITTEDDVAETIAPKSTESPDVSKSEKLPESLGTSTNPSLSVAPDLKSEAVTAVDVTPDIKPKVGNWNYNEIERILNKSTSNRVEKERLTKLLLSASGKSSRKKAQKVYNNKQEGSEDYQALRVALGKAKIPDETVRKMLFDLNIFKKGGILKAEGGNSAPIVAPDWYKNLYGNRTSLIGWTSDTDSSNWVTDESTFHGNADSLDSVFKANQAYTQDKNAVGKDIQNYYKSGESLSDFVTRYNADAGKIRSFWDSDQSYGGDASLHNPLFRNMFASRSATTGGNANYNLNYLENLLNKIGSSTWHRRMDSYEKDWEQLTDNEKLARLHKINLGNNNYGYVYKKANGDIAELNQNEAERLLGGKGTVIKISGNKPAEKAEETEKLPKPTKPKELFLTTDKLLELWKYYDTLRHNDNQLELSNLLEPLLYDPLEHESVVKGDLPTRNSYYRKAADLMSFNPISTSDSNAYFAQMLERKNKALQYELQGDLADNEAIRTFQEAAREQAKENAENRYNIAMKNRENLSQNRKEKLLALMTKERSDYESNANINSTILNWIKLYNAIEQKRNNLLFSTKLNNWIQDNPSEYILGWGPYYQSIVDKHNQGLTLTSEEQRILYQIQSVLSDVYQLEVLGDQIANKQKINKPAWNPTINKKGGKVTKKYKDTIIKYLQESNKNYNKAIDRSIKGLYNSIKLERRK